MSAIGASLFIRLLILNVVVRCSIVRRDLRADICSDERSFVTSPTLQDARQHPACSNDVL